jgi:hypothetical protein
MSVISNPFPWSPLKLHSNSTPWSGNGVKIKRIIGVKVRNFELFREYFSIIIKQLFIFW